MAEHTLTIKAKLDDNEVQSKLNKLNSGGGGGGGSNPSNEVNQLAKAMGNLKRALAGGAVFNSFLNLADGIKMFGQEGDKTAQRLKGSVSRMMAAIGSGNPIIMAATAGMEAMSFAAGKLSDELDRAKKDLELL
jgi:hypothetical protein